MIGCAELSSAPGAYALWIDLARATTLPISRLGKPHLAPGRYVYCGSARGPGGIRARVSRHLRADRSNHWHVDHLTRAGAISAVLAVPGGDECDLTLALLGAPGAALPVPGFGSSDCGRCLSHLVAVPGGAEVSIPDLLPLAARLFKIRHGD